MTSSDRFAVPVRSAVKSNLTDWCFQNLSKRALNALTVQASTTELNSTGHDHAGKIQTETALFTYEFRFHLTIKQCRMPSGLQLLLIIFFGLQSAR